MRAFDAHAASTKEKKINTPLIQEVVEQKLKQRSNLNNYSSKVHTTTNTTEVDPEEPCTIEQEKKTEKDSANKVALEKHNLWLSKYTGNHSTEATNNNKRDVTTPNSQTSVTHNSALILVKPKRPSAIVEVLE